MDRLWAAGAFALGLLLGTEQKVLQQVEFAVSLPSLLCDAEDKAVGQVHLGLQGTGTAVVILVTSCPVKWRPQKLDKEVFFFKFLI